MSTDSESEETQIQPEVNRVESELGLDLDVHFLPAWAQKSTNENKYADYKGDDRGESRGRDRGGRPQNRGFGGGGDRGPRRGPRPEGQRGPGGPRPGGQGGFGGERGRGDRGPRGRGPSRGPNREGSQTREPMKLPELEVSFIPEEKGVESLARQIKLTGRAYPLFEIAYLVLKKPERYHVQLSSKKKPDGQPVQPIFVCGLDDTIWLDQTDAMVHVLDKHFATFYSSEKIPTEPPKGTYTFVAQCGISGAILGPPNYHDYQNKLRKLHQERFARMPFEAFKSRIRIVKDEAIVKKWLEEQSFKTEFTCLNIPETIKLNTREEVDRHFRETHLSNVVKVVDSYTLAGTSVHAIQNRPLHALIRRSFDEQMRFPLKVVNILSGQFSRQGLQFFKVNRTVTHVAVARPRYLDMEATPVSEGVRKIVDFINAHPRTNRRKLIEALVPGGAAAGTGAAAPTPAQPEPSAPAEAQSEATAEAPVQNEAATSAETTPSAEAPAPAPAVSPALAALNADLHWLVHQGHVIEFANGILETAKKPAPRPVKPQPAEKQGAEGAGEQPAQQGGEQSGEGASVEGEVQGHEENALETSNPEAETTVQDESGASAGADVPSEVKLPLSEAQSNPKPESGESAS